MAALPAPILPRVASLLRLLGSDHDHEALGAVRALRRTLSGAGVDLNDLGDAIERPAPIAPTRRTRKPRTDRGHIDWPPSHRREVREALERGLARLSLTPPERQFTTDIIARLRDPRGRLTFRQAEVVDRLVVKIEGCR